jgi:hypothetical protein
MTIYARTSYFDTSLGFRRKTPGRFASFFQLTKTRVEGTKSEQKTEKGSTRAEFSLPAHKAADKKVAFEIF